MRTRFPLGTGSAGQRVHHICLAIKREEHRQFTAEVGEQGWRWYLGHA
ncbi:hypothetical protein [Stutzerimonas tarimensis]|uniref:Uncharacterized protein n=1 Tax=Stutzerimonas tarimensis TaxID=1507735 RepID=A0ABV7T4N6_9GAMM